MPVGREPPPLDAELILRALADLAVDYVLIGGLAVQTHGHVRTAVDADIVPRPQPENLDCLARALTRLDARPLNLDHEHAPIDAAMLSHVTIWQFDTAGGGLGVLRDALAALPMTISGSGRWRWSSGASPSRWPASTTSSA